MGPRISRYVIAVVAISSFPCAEAARAQVSPITPPPLLQHETSIELPSIEWLTAESSVAVRGVVVDVAAEEATADSLWLWHIVTLDLCETLKGEKSQRLKFAMRFDRSNSAPGRWKKSNAELLWIFKRLPSADPGSPQTGNRTVADAPWVWELSTPVNPLGPQGPEAGLQPPRFLPISSDLRMLKTPDELLKAVRDAVAENQGPASVRKHVLKLPMAIAQRIGCNANNVALNVPVDHRLEELARRLIQSPGDFLTTDDAASRQQLRLEGVKALRLFPSEKNLALLKGWLDNPLSTQPIKGAAKIRIEDLLPPSPRAQKTDRKPTLPQRLAEVPEVNFQEPLSVHLKTADAQLHTAVTIDRVHLLNQRKTDGFIEELMRQRPDLAGLSFAMGDACRMNEEASRQFVVALAEVKSVNARATLNKLIAEWTVALKNTDPNTKLTSEQRKQGEEVIRECERRLAQLDTLNDSARIAPMMQVHGPEYIQTRLDMVQDLDGMSHADATRALAKLAIFSEEAEIRTAAVRALKMRRDKDYTDLLLTGLKYPWPAVAERASEAIVKLGRTDLIPHLIDVLEGQDPRAPQTLEKNGKKVAVVRELVRINHHHNCLLCHAPDTSSREKSSAAETAKLTKLTAQVPVPSETMTAYYRPESPDILVRFDVTYLRQDFSVKLPVAYAEPWPEMQRYDFLVRTREVNDQEAVVYRELLQKGRSPYHRAVVSALRELTGGDAEPTATAWRKIARQ